MCSDKQRKIHIFEHVKYYSKPSTSRKYETMNRIIIQNQVQVVNTKQLTRLLFKPSKSRKSETMNQIDYKDNFILKV